MSQNKFVPLKQTTGREVKKGLIDNSQTIAVGEVIIPAVQGDTSVIITGGGTTLDLFGVVLGIEGKAGKVLEVDSYAAESDNVTDKMVQVSFVPLFIPMEFAATLDAAAETTDNSSAYGNFAVDATGLLLDESTYAAFGTKSNKQFFSNGLTPGTTTEVTGRFIATIIA